MTITLVPTAIALASSTTPTAPQGVTAAVRTAKRDRQVLRFFATHAWLLADPRFAAEATRQVRDHRRSLGAALRTIAAREPLTHRRAHRAVTTRRGETPRHAICRVFGRRWCAEAIAVARCESRLHTDAVNGQYLGLFQMGSTARELYGHGSSADIQARAALRYFVASGRDWSPWSCRPR